MRITSPSWISIILLANKKRPTSLMTRRAQYSDIPSRIVPKTAYQMMAGGLRGAGRPPQQKYSIKGLKVQEVLSTLFANCKTFTFQRINRGAFFPRAANAVHPSCNVTLIRNFGD
jgi:hypothetical protein